MTPAPGPTPMSPARCLRRAKYWRRLDWSAAWIVCCSRADRVYSDNSNNIPDMICAPGDHGLLGVASCGSSLACEPSFRLGYGFLQANDIERLLYYRHVQLHQQPTQMRRNELRMRQPEPQPQLVQL